MSAELELWRAYRRTRAVDVRDRLVERHLVLVKYIAARVSGRLPRHVLMDDLYSAALCGFLGAVEGFNPDVGASFLAYATPRIRGAIFDELRRLDLVPRGVRRRLREVERAMDTLTARLDREPSDEEVAAELAISLDEYHQLLGAGVTVISLDAALTPDDGPAHTALPLKDVDTPSPVDVLDANERRRALGQFIDALPDRERRVLALYYVEGLTMREVGQVLGVTESRVSQLHSSGILRLRAALRRHGARAEPARRRAGSGQLLVNRR